MSMSWLSAGHRPGMVVNQGRDRSGELRRLFGLKKTDKLVYIYIGRYGQSDLDWSRFTAVSSIRAFISWAITLRLAVSPTICTWYRRPIGREEI